MVSPQLHVHNDDFFETVCPTEINAPTLSHWKQLYGFKRDRPHRVQPQDRVTGPEPVIPNQAQ